MPRNREAEIFAEALRVSPARRPEFLARACAGDAAFRVRIEALLAAHREGEDFLKEPFVRRKARKPDKRRPHPP